MKKMTLLLVFVIMSMMLLSTVSLPVFAHGLPGSQVYLPIAFSGKIAISQVDVIQWRIVVDGTVTIDGEVHEGKYTVVKMLPSEGGEILHGPVTAFHWKMKKCQLKMVVKEIGINLNVLWEATSPTDGGESGGTLSFGGDTFDFVGVYQYREADVSGVQKTLRGIIHRTGTGYIAEGTGTINPPVPS